MKQISPLVCFLSVLLGFTALAEWKIETIAGVGTPGLSGDYGKALNSYLYNPFGVVRGPDKALWFCDSGNNRIRQIRPDGIIFTFAGSGSKEFTPSGTWVQETALKRPPELRFDAKGDMFISDMGNHVIRKVDMQTGKVDIVAGTGLAGYSGDGDAALIAHLRQPQGIQFSPEGDLYICDTGNNVIRRLEMKTGVITTFAGTGTPGLTPDGAPIEGTSLNGPRAIDFDRNGDLWLATKEGSQIFKFDMKARRIRLVAGTGAKGMKGGPGKQATFSGPTGLSLDAEGNAWVADTENSAVRRIDGKSGEVSLIAGTGERGDGPDGDPLQCKFSRLHGIFADADGSVFIGDSEAHRLRVLRKK